MYIMGKVISSALKFTFIVTLIVYETKLSVRSIQKLKKKFTKIQIFKYPEHLLQCTSMYIMEKLISFVTEKSPRFI